MGLVVEDVGLIIEDVWLVVKAVGMCEEDIGLAGEIGSILDWGYGMRGMRLGRRDIG